MTVVGCGSRIWNDQAAVDAVLGVVLAQHPALTVIEGKNPNGADQQVGLWADRARRRGVHHIGIHAHWDRYPPELRWQAGHDRNQVMVDMLLAAHEKGHAVATVAFKLTLDGNLFGHQPDRARGGTEDMVRRSWANGIDVWHVPTYGVETLIEPGSLPGLG